MKAAAYTLIRTIRCTEGPQGLVITNIGEVENVGALFPRTNPQYIVVVRHQDNVKLQEVYDTEALALARHTAICRELGIDE
jgi:hypothetical protein